MIFLYFYLASVLLCWLAFRHCVKSDQKNGIKVSGSTLIKGIFFIIIPMLNTVFALVIFIGLCVEKLQDIEVSDKLTRVFFLIRKEK